MNDPILLVAVIAGLAVTCAFCVRGMLPGNRRVSRRSDRVIRKVRETQDPQRLREIWRRWDNPEIRQAVAISCPPGERLRCCRA